MFFAAQPPPETVFGELRVLRLSLNTPVVDAEELPVGPARAGIALCDGPSDLPTVAVRSVRNGRLACYAAEREQGDRVDPSLALDAALSFAESMGFLFDDDEVEARGDDGPREAGDLWRELLGLTGGLSPDSAVDLAAERVLTKFRRTRVRYEGENDEKAG